jgi:hypothetical protein
MALILPGSGRFADDPDTRREVNAMRDHNSVFHGLKQRFWPVPRREHAASLREAEKSSIVDARPAYGRPFSL